MKILAVDTTAAAASCALCEDGLVLGEYFVNIKQTHSQTLMPMVMSLLGCCGLKPQDIGLFAVSVGPGSFTGVRIGVAAVKGLALPFLAPCAAVSSLEALALNAAAADCVVCAVMDARRSQFYNALFSAKTGTLERLTQDRAVAYDELKKELADLVSSGKKVLLVGDGAKICYNRLNGDGVIGVDCAPENCLFARASSVAAAGLSRFLSGETVTAEALLPSYLRLPQAERELKKRTAPN